MAFLSLALLAVHFTVGYLASYANAGTSELAVGQSIFEQGIGRDGREVGGRIHGNVLMRGQAIACASCHGKDARGGEEAFVRAPDIRWHTLSKPFAPRHIGVSRPAYDQSTFARAIRLGVGSNDEALDPAMPRFDLSQDEIDALVRHLGTQAWARDAGSSSKVVLGLLPSSHSDRWGQELGERLHSCPSTDILERFPPFEIISYRDPRDALAKLSDKVLKGHVSYILAPYIVGWEAQYFEAATDWPVSTWMPITPLDSPSRPNFNFSFPGLNSQVEALLTRGVSNRLESLTVLRSGNNLPAQEALNFVRNELRKHNLRLDDLVLERAKSINIGAVWLILAPLEQVSQKLGDVIRRKTNRTALVPAMFFDPVAAQKIEKQLPGIVWQIAYPYPPINAQTRRWSTPVDAWAEAGCALMKAIAEEQKTGSRFAPSSITLQSGLRLLNTYDGVSRHEQVIVEQWGKFKSLR